jgi:hypothetical protein
MRKQSKAEKAIDRRIENAYRATCSGIQIDIMDIGKVFARGREILATGVGDSRLGVELREYVTTNLARK